MAQRLADFDLERQLSLLSESPENIHPSAALRRKLQNRLNQRNCRERKKQQLQPLSSVHPGGKKWTIYIGEKVETEEVLDSQLHFPQKITGDVIAERDVIQKDWPHFCHLGPTERNVYISHLQAQVYNGVMHHMLRCDMLLSVTQYNIFVAMNINAAYLGLTMDSLRYDIQSPFNTQEPWGLTLPPSLQPTHLQRQVPHHPWMDLCPVPCVRDVMIKKVGEYDEDKLCHDMFGACGGQHGQAGILIWGEAWDPMSYEVSEDVLRKWFWLFKDCSEVIESTNRWRLRRGDEPIEMSELSNDSAMVRNKC